MCECVGCGKELPVTESHMYCCHNCWRKVRTHWGSDKNKRAKDVWTKLVLQNQELGKAFFEPRLKELINEVKNLLGEQK